MTTKVLVSQLSVLPGVATQGQSLSLQVGANNTIVAAVTSAGGGSSDEIDSFLLAGM
jgi:hypothetical protein